jgi:hypothetical protein
MAFDFGSGVNAAKKSFMTIGLPMLVGAFVVSFLMAIIAGKSE